LVGGYFEFKYYYEIINFYLQILAYIGFKSYNVTLVPTPKELCKNFKLIFHHLIFKLFFILKLKYIWSFYLHIDPTNSIPNFPLYPKVLLVINFYPLNIYF